MKGVVLAGGRGTRLKSLTATVNKHLLPVYDKPLIHWPVMTLVRIGIGDICIVSNPEDIERYRTLFGDGSALGVSISYAAQATPDGIASALAVAEDFANGDSLAVILGDNIFMDATEIRSALQAFRDGGEKGGLVFLKEVSDPQRFGIATIEGDIVRSIEEKPPHPASNLAVTGLYFYDKDAFAAVRSIQPSARGELEITDVNKTYAARGLLHFRTLKGAWIDAGTHESLFQANLIAGGMDYFAAPKIKILFGINKLAVGGAEHLVLHQLARINRDRFEPHLVTLLPSTEPNLNAEAKPLGARWRQFSFRGFSDIGSFWKLYRYLRQEKFDVVVTSLFFTSIVLRAAAIVAHVPVILVNEVNVSTEEDGKSIFLEKLLARFTDRFLAVSKEVLEVRSRALSVSLEKFTLNYSAIDLAVSNNPLSSEDREAIRLRYSATPDTIAITTAGRLTEQKGQKYLIEAFARLRGKMPDSSVRLIIFGEGPLRNDLKNDVERLGLGDSVMFPGVAPLPEIIALTDIFTLPSLWEGMSLMLLEAMAGGKPIVATDISGSKELITDKENGFLVPPKDVDALAEKMMSLVRDPALRATFGRASVKEVQKFSIETNLNTLYGVIHEVLARKRRGKKHV